MNEIIKLLKLDGNYYAWTDEEDYRDYYSYLEDKIDKISEILV